MSKTYKPSDEIAAKLSGLEEQQATIIQDALRVWTFIVAAANTEDRTISVNKLHKASGSGLSNRTKSDVNEVLDRLQGVGVLSGSVWLPSTGGRPREIRTVSTEWIAANDAAFAELEEKLFELLLQSVQDEASGAAQMPPKQPAEIPTDSGPVRVLRDMRIIHNGVTWWQKAGDVITDRVLCRMLLAERYPVAPIDDLDLEGCKCGNTFRPSEAPILGEMPVVCLQDLSIRYNGVKILRKQGEIESDRLLIAFLIEQGYPVARASKEQVTCCPSCKRVFERQAALGVPCREVSCSAVPQRQVLPKRIENYSSLDNTQSHDPHVRALARAKQARSAEGQTVVFLGKQQVTLPKHLPVDQWRQAGMPRAGLR